MGEPFFRLLKLRSLRAWWRTRHCNHDGTERSQLIETGTNKMFWCTRCQRTWFAW